MTYADRIAPGVGFAVTLNQGMTTEQENQLSRMPEFADGAVGVVLYDEHPTILEYDHFTGGEDVDTALIRVFTGIQKIPGLEPVKVTTIEDGSGATELLTYDEVVTLAAATANR